MELTGAGVERIVVVLSDQPVDVDAAKRAAAPASDKNCVGIWCISRASACRAKSSRGRSRNRRRMRSVRLVAVLLLSLVASAARGQGLHRFAIVAGNDTGGGDTAR